MAADPLSISAGVVGLVVPALHGLRLVLHDLRLIRDAPRSIGLLKDDLESLEKVVCMLQNLSESDLKRLGSGIRDQLQDALQVCKTSSLELYELLKSCTRHSIGRSTLAWRDRANIALVADKEITTMSTQLQSAKATLTLNMSVATLSIAIRTGDTDNDLAQNNHAYPGTTTTTQGSNLSIRRLPFRRDPCFIDRGEMSLLESKMTGDTARVALVGLGGIGKSQLAIEYCFRSQTDEPSTTILWVQAGNSARYLQSMYDIAKLARLDNYDKSSSNILEVVSDWLQSTLQTRWVMVLDGLDDATYLSRPLTSSQSASKCILDYIPTTQNGAILVTSRSRQAALRLVDTSEIIDISVMRSDKSVQLLAQKLKVEVDDDIKELAAELEHVPLALAQAAAYLQKMWPMVQPRKLLQQLRDLETVKVELLMADVSLDLRRDRQISNSTFLTWQISFEQIQCQRPSATDLLSVLSFFDSKNIPLWLLRCYNTRYTLNQTKTVSNLAKDFSPNYQLELDLCLLQDYLFVTIEYSTDCLAMHDLVQMAAREWLKAQEGSLYVDSLQQSLRLLDIEFPQPKFEAWPKCMTLLPHTTKLLAFEPGMNSITLKHWSAIAERSIWFALDNGFDDEKVLMLSKLLSLEQAAKSDTNYSGSDDACLQSKGKRWSAHIANAIASIYEYKGDDAEAEKRRAYVLEETQRIHGDSDLETEVALVNLACVHGQLGKYDEAYAGLKKVALDRSFKLGPHHPSTLQALTNYARLCSKKGDYATAKRVYHEVHQSRQALLPEDHPEIALSLWDVSVCESRCGHYAAAEEMMLRVVDILSRTCKADSQKFLKSRTQLGTLYRLQGKWAKASSLQKDILRVLREKFGDAHPHTLFIMAQLATTYSEEGRYDMAEEIERDVLRKRQSKLVEDHEDVLEAMLNLSTTLAEVDGLDEAEILASKALKLRADHPLAMRTLGTILRRRGRYHEASALNVKVLDIEKKRTGDQSPAALSAMCNLAASRRDEGLLEEAEQLISEAVREGEGVWGSEHPHYLVARTNMAETFIAQGRKQEARALLQNILEVRTRTIGSTHPDTEKNMRLLRGLGTVSEPTPLG